MFCTDGPRSGADERLCVGDDQVKPRISDIIICFGQAG